MVRSFDFGWSRAGAAPPVQPVKFVVTFTIKVNTFMGRPPGRIQDRPFQMRLSNEFLERLDEWRRKQPDHPSRAESIRRLAIDMLQILDGTNSAIYHYMSQDQKKPLTSPQIRAARALLRWSAEDLSRHSAVSLRTIRRAELAEQQTAMTAANDLAIRHALESAGVEFTDENGGGVGVRLCKRMRSKSAK
jgi:hypothetical protein